MCVVERCSIGMEVPPGMCPMQTADNIQLCLFVLSKGNCESKLPIGKLQSRSFWQQNVLTTDCKCRHLLRGNVAIFLRYKSSNVINLWQPRAESASEEAKRNGAKGKWPRAKLLVNIDRGAQTFTITEVISEVRKEKLPAEGRPLTGTWDGPDHKPVASTDKRQTSERAQSGK